MSNRIVKKILILGCSTKAGTYVTKQFHKLGYEVTVYDWKNLPNKWSRYLDTYIQADSPEKDLEAFERDFLNYLSAHSFQALVPLHDQALEIVRHLGKRIPAGVKVLGLNRDEIYTYAHNKWDLLKLSRENGIAVPETVYASSLSDLKGSFKFPCVVKPVSSALIKNGRLYSFGVSIVKDQQELEDRVREVILNVPVMVQEFIEGYGIGFNFIAKEGELLNSYIHQRITEHGGVSSYRKILKDTAYGNKEAVAGLIKKISWTGVGMLEFKVQNNVPVVMELNGRFFGSIEVSTKSGLNLPEQFIEQQLNSRLPEKNRHFNLETKVRNLHDEVLLNLADLGKGKIGSYLKWKLGVVRSLFDKNDFTEDNVFDDPGFVLALYGADLKRVFGKFGKRLKLRFIHLKKNMAQLNSSNAMNIAFMCKGNICRSPFAEAYARSLHSKHTFYSFGSYVQENRLSPVNALKAAGAFHISLDKHTSRFLKADIAKTMDLFIVMDKLNYLDLLNMGIPGSKIKFLSGKEIPDPYKKNYNYFVDIYSTIKTGIDQLLKHEKIS